MARRARMIIPGVAHHVTQRGNRSERIFLEDGDDRSISTCRHTTSSVSRGLLGYCLMPNTDVSHLTRVEDVPWRWEEQTGQNG
jgi:putative transposase